MNRRSIAARLGGAFAVAAVAAALSSTALGGEANPGAEEEDARRILEAAGVDAGLVVHLGCGDGRLTAALGRSGRFVVHGLDRSEEAVSEARRHVAETGLYGRVSIARIGGERLPYIDNLVNLIVCEKPLGIGEKEALRVLAPRGVLLVRKGPITPPSQTLHHLAASALARSWPTEHLLAGNRR
jgi:SAM-dependent methyltransferase